MGGGQPGYPPGVSDRDFDDAPEEGPQVHELKIWPEYFDAVQRREKTFEVRQNDRDFNEGDTLILKEWDRRENIFTGREIKAEVPYILYGGQWGIEKGVVVMALRLLAGDRG